MKVEIELDELNRFVEIEKKYLIIEKGLNIAQEIIEANKTTSKKSPFRERLEEAQRKQEEAKRAAKN